MEAFEEHFTKVMTEGAPIQYMKRLADRPDIDTGDMQFLQASLYTWKPWSAPRPTSCSTTPSRPAPSCSAAGHIGVRRTTPAWNMSYGCEIPITYATISSTSSSASCGAPRGPATKVGISIYGSVDHVDAGAIISAPTNSAPRGSSTGTTPASPACPSAKCSTTRAISRARRPSTPTAIWTAQHAAEVAILFPLKLQSRARLHGKGMLWGVSELNLSGKTARASRTAL